MDRSIPLQGNAVATFPIKWRQDTSEYVVQSVEQQQALANPPRPGDRLIRIGGEVSPASEECLRTATGSALMPARGPNGR